MIKIICIYKTNLVVIISFYFCLLYVSHPSHNNNHSTFIFFQKLNSQSTYPLQNEENQTLFLLHPNFFSRNHSQQSRPSDPHPHKNPSKTSSQAQINLKAMAFLHFQPPILSFPLSPPPKPGLSNPRSSLFRRCKLLQTTF